MTSDADVSAPSNPAAALFAALKPIYVDNPNQALHDGLAASFGFQFGTPDFWTVHRAYLRITEKVVVLVGSHPNLQQQYARFVESWRRCVLPNTAWDRPASENVSSYDVQSLEFLAGTLDVMNVGNGELNAELTDQLEHLVTGWRQLIESLDLPPALAAELLIRLQELEWMTKNVARFGVAAVADAAERLAARATREVFRPSLPARARGGLIALVSATMIFVGGANTATNDFAGAIEGINSSITQVQELEENVKEIFSGSLTIGKTHSNRGEEDDVVDAEVVDETTSPAE